MAGLPINFAVPGEGAVASYEWADIMDGTGVIDFDGYSTTSASATARWCSPNVLGTSLKYWGGFLNTSGTETINFDSSAVNTPRTIRGNAKVRYTMALYNNTSGTFTIQTTFSIVRLRGAVETTLGTTIGPTLTNSVDDTGVHDTYFLDIALTETSFAIGDILRIKAVVTYNFQRGFLMHDPLDRNFEYFTAYTIDAGQNPTSLKIQVPFKIDL